MATNTPLSPPPTQNEVTDKMSGRLTLSWLHWFTNLYFLYSPQNFQTISSNAIVNLDARYVSLTADDTTGAYAITLDPPTLANVDKTIEMVSQGGSNNVTLSLANVTNVGAATTCTWTGTNQQLVLKSASAKWMLIAQNGVTLT